MKTFYEWLDEDEAIPFLEVANVLLTLPDSNPYKESYLNRITDEARLAWIFYKEKEAK